MAIGVKDILGADRAALVLTEVQEGIAGDAAPWQEGDIRLPHYHALSTMPGQSARFHVAKPGYQYAGSRRCLAMLIPMSGREEAAI
jgi:hypothetical protein